MTACGWVTVATSSAMSDGVAQCVDCDSCSGVGGKVRDISCRSSRLGIRAISSRSNSLGSAACTGGISASSFGRQTVQRGHTPCRPLLPFDRFHHLVHLIIIITALNELFKLLFLGPLTSAAADTVYSLSDTTRSSPVPGVRLFRRPGLSNRSSVSWRALMKGRRLGRAALSALNCSSGWSGGSKLQRLYASALISTLSSSLLS